MKKSVVCISILFVLLFVLTGCSNDENTMDKSIEQNTIYEVENENTNEKDTNKIKMPESSETYENGDWTFESLTNHFKELGFTTIEGIPCDPNSDKFEKNIFQVEICTGLFNEDPWEKDNEFNKDDKIKIYYNEFPMLTVDNCEELKNILNGTVTSYEEFIELYDGRYVGFEAVVSEHIIYMGDTEHIIEVKGENSDGVIIRIGNRTWGHHIDETVEIGDKVVVKGKFDKSWTEYFKTLYVETFDLRRP